MTSGVHICHIPKTGGLTLHRALHFAGIPATRSHDPAEARHAAQQGARIVLLLRDPVDRVVSLYRYQHRRGRVSTLDDLLNEPGSPWWWGACNVQTWYWTHAQSWPNVLVYRDVDRAVRGLCDLCDVTYPAGYESVNVTPADDLVITPEDRARIATGNWFDEILWGRE
jgi:hypothetical protein